MSRRTSQTTDEDYTDEPIYWFAILDRAVEQGNHTAAAEAQGELERLGIRIRYGRPRSREGDRAQPS
jgi:hypothetical protein